MLIDTTICDKEQYTQIAYAAREARLCPSSTTLVVRPDCFEITRAKRYASRLRIKFPGDRVIIRKDGDRLIIEPVQKKNLLEVLADLHPLSLEDEFPEIDISLLPARKIGL